MTDENRPLESAIPRHLRTERTNASKCPFGAKPPYPTYVARFDAAVTRVVIGYFGVQCRRDAAHLLADGAAQIEHLFAQPHGPLHHDCADCVDQAGYVNRVFAAYWDDAAPFRLWRNSSVVSGWWDALERKCDEVGWFQEIFSPRVTDYETHFSTHRPEGIAVLSQTMSGEIEEHAYWGSARDRIPRSQADDLRESGTPRSMRSSSGRRVRVHPQDNLCVIRSGQDWSDSDQAERALYDRDIRPHLDRGMRFLRDEGLSVGCYANRFADLLAPDGSSTDKSYATSFWKSLAHLESWAADHPTHLAIYGAAIAYMRKLGPNAGLRTYHEIAVLRSEDQFFEYVNCHDRTGMLAADSAPPRT